MTSVNVYLNFDGNCEEAFNFYRLAFGGEFSYSAKFKDMTAQDGAKAMDIDDNRIMHICLPISKETMLMGSDTGGEWAASFTKGNNFSISIYTDTKDEADRLFNALSAEGTVTMPMN